MRRGRLLTGTLVVAALPVVAWLGANLFLNFGLAAWLNARPETLRIDYEHAWLSPALELSIQGLGIRAQSENDQWLLTVDRATTRVDLAALADRCFSADEVRASGVSFRYRRRVDAPEFPSTTPELDPDIPGLENPPVGQSAEWAGAGETEGPWRLVLRGIQVERAREVWVGPVRFTGDATVAGGLDITPSRHVWVPYANAWVTTGQVDFGADAVASHIEGRLLAAIAPLDLTEGPGGDVIPALSAGARLTAQADDLRFLNRWLHDAPWIGLDGSAERLDVDGRLVRGRFVDGSSLTAETQDLVAHFLTYRIVGDARVRLGVEPTTRGSESFMEVHFSDYAIRQKDGKSPLVEGEGFRVTARSPVVSLDQPLTTLAVVLDLPDSIVRDVTEYNSYLPADIGLSLKGGSGRVHGRLQATIPDNRAKGELVLDARGVRASFDDLVLSGDVGLRAHLADGRLDTGTYDLSGSRIDLRDLRVETGAQPAGPGGAAVVGTGQEAAGADGAGVTAPVRAKLFTKLFGDAVPAKGPAVKAAEHPGPGLQLFGKLARRAGQTAGWWAKMEVPECHVQVGAEVFLRARLAVRLRDTVPIINIFSRKAALPDWIRGLMAVNDVSGTAEVQLGDTTMNIPSFQVRGGNYDVRMRLARKGTVYRGVLFAGYGPLSLGAELFGEKIKLHVFEPKPWFEAHAPLE